MSESKWYVAEGGQSRGPLTDEEIIADYRQGGLTGKTMVYKQGLAGWQPLAATPELIALVGGDKPGAGGLPPLPRKGPLADEIDYLIHGQEMQFVEVELDPGESAVAEAGAMMYMSDGIAMETIFGDGRASPRARGLMDHLIGAGKRLVTGESLFMTVFNHVSNRPKEHVAFAAPYPGKILALHLSDHDEELICQKDAFLAAAKGVALEIAFQKKIGVGLFGGEGFIMQRLMGDGLVFIHAGGTVVERELQPGERLRLDTGCLVALTRTVGYDVEMVSGVKTALFGGEGLFVVNLSGPGRVWLQSLPFSRLADRIYKAAPQGGGKNVGEGSILGGLGRMLSGD